MNREASPSVATGQFLFFRQVGQLFSASIVGQGMGLVRSMVLTVFFSPAQLGVWNFLHVIFGYGANAHLGILSGMNKLVPRYLAQGEDERAERTEESVFWCNLVLGAILAVTVYIASYAAPLPFQT